MLIYFVVDGFCDIVVIAVYTFIIIPTKILNNLLVANVRRHTYKYTRCTSTIRGCDDVPNVECV